MLRDHRHDESGSIAIAMTVMLVLALLSVGVLARTTSSQTQVRRNQDFNGALAGADAGISDALYQLDQGVTGAADPTCPTLCFGKTNVALPGGDTFSYRATQAINTLVTPPIQDTNVYIVHASGTVNGVKHNAIVTARRRQRFDYALFARDRLDLNGSCPSPPAVPAFGPVGSSGIIITSTNCTPVAHCFLPDNQIPAPTSNGCKDPAPTYGGNSLNPNGQRLNETNIKRTVGRIINDFQAESYQQLACPLSWESTGVITGTVPAPPANSYHLCNRPGGFTLSGTLAVAAPPAPETRIVLETGTLTLAAGAQASVASNPAAQLQIYVNDPSNMELKGSGSTGAVFVGGLYAPESKFLFSPTGTNTFKGALLAREIRVNGAPNLGYLDQSFTKITTESWKITRYREVPSTCALTNTTC